MKTRLLTGAVSFLLLASVAHAANTNVTAVDQPATGGTNPHYVANRPPLRAQPLIKLPIGAIEPRGWLRTQLELQAAGFVGHLPEISEFLREEGNAWRSPTGAGHSPWEEVPYWLKGFGDLGYVLGDQRIIDEAKEWIDAVIASQRDDGYFGPRSNLTRIDGTPDVWPNMIMLNALQSYYEFSGDPRVPKLMGRYFRWQAQIPEDEFLRPFWQQQRAADNLASVYWLYNRTGQGWLLDLAKKIHRNTADWTQGVANWHGVNIAQAFRGPANYFVQSKNPVHLNATERNYREVMQRYGRVPGGMFGADEVCRPGYTGPRQAAETCTMVEFMLSFEMLLKITGDTKWADRCEEVAFNSLPAALTADLKALRYLTAPNMPQSDAESKAPGILNRGPMYLMDPHRHRCCQHNVAHGWPYYAEHLWLATPDRGLAAVLYAASAVNARVGDDGRVTITAETDYPFGEDITLHIKPEEPVRFPLYLRVPGWCLAPAVYLNGQQHPVTAGPGQYIRIERTWQVDDEVTLRLPMSLDVTRWEDNGTVSVGYGPLTYSLAIDEAYHRAGGTDTWPAWEVYPASDWNYGLVLDKTDPVESFAVVRETGPLPERPFDPGNVPIKLLARGRQIPQWQLDHRGLIDEVEESPAYTTEPIEEITLIPMGAARIRLTAFPTVSDDPAAHKWAPPPTPAPAEASHCFTGDTLAALSDGQVPAHSNDQGVPRFTWWDRRSTTEWVQYNFDDPRRVGRAAVYWFDDRPEGGCRVPARWRLLYRDRDVWRAVPNASGYGTERDRFNTATFPPVTTTGLRIEATLQDGFSAGILEWQVSDPTDKAAAGAVPKRLEYPIQPVPFTAVKVEDEFWLPRLKTNQAVTVPHVFEQCERTGRINNFAKAAGLMEGGYEGYEFNDSDVFKLLEGASYALMIEPNPELRQRVDHVIKLIAGAQEDDGYLYAHRTIHEDNPSERAGPERWSNLVHNHELYNLGHLYEAAVAHFQATQTRDLLDVAVKSADLITRVFGPGGLRDVPGHEEVEIGLVRLYRVTGDERYLHLARFFLDERGHYHDRACYGVYAQDHKPVVEQDHPEGHAVRAVYLYCGMADVAAIMGDQDYIRAIDRIWDNMVSKRLYVTGGIGARHGGESFGDDYELPNAAAYSETCASIANVFWNQRMFLLHGDGRYIDVLERTLYNALLAGISMEGNEFFYVNPLASFGDRERQPWFNCACCPTNMVRFMPSLPGYIYALQDDKVYVNLFIGGQSDLRVQDTDVRIRQVTRYPWRGRIELHVEPAAPTALELLVRIPGWAREEPVPSGLYRFVERRDERPTLMVNGEQVSLELHKGYARLRRTWQPGDVVTLELPMPVRRLKANPAVAANRNRVALQRGPLVYCVEGVDHDGFTRDLILPGDARVDANMRGDLLGGVVALAAEARRLAAAGAAADSQPTRLSAIPYYAWNHRDKGDMNVWLAETPAEARPQPVPSLATGAGIRTSHTHDRPTALNDQVTPTSSHDYGVARFTWWDHTGTTEWVQYDFTAPVSVREVSVYWFDDGGRGECRLPQSWRLLYQAGDQWRPVPDVREYPIAPNQFNTVTFKPIQTDSLRLEVQLQDGYSGGVLEWSVR